MQGWIDVGSGHHLYFEECGNPQGIPALFLHGGPGSGCNPKQHGFFDPDRYRAVFLDQRGCGRSLPLGDIKHNRTTDLIRDIEMLREHLDIPRWLVFGGSWGASLAIAYAANHPRRVSGLILRGIFLTGQRDLDWFFQDSRQQFQEAWRSFANFAPPRWRGNLLHYYARALHDPNTAAAAAAHWSAFESALINPTHTQTPTPQTSDETAQQIAKYRIQAHYLTQYCFLGEETLLTMARSLKKIPCAILHGSLDLVCTAENAQTLHQSISGSHMQLVANTGHSPFSPPMARALISATDYFAEHGNFSDWKSA